MLYANDKHGNKVKATPHGEALCPLCSSEMIAKCGDVKIWHWAHRSMADCDAWGESETEWHLEWKSHLPVSNVEVVIEKNGVKHRADIITPGGIVLELQHSPLSTEVVLEREQFYRRMIWLFDVQECAKPQPPHVPFTMEGTAFVPRPYKQLEIDNWPRNTASLSTSDASDGTCGFKWRWARKYVYAARKPRYLDIGEGYVFRVTSLDNYGEGQGYTLSRDTLINKLKSN